MDALPDEVLLRILSRFHDADELARLAFVSRRGWHLCKHVPNLIISSRSTLESVLSSTIESLMINCSEAVYTTIWTRLTELPKLSVLTIAFGRIEQSPDGFLFRNLHECQLWMVLGISSANLEALVKACPALHTLRVFFCDDMVSPLSLDSKSLQSFQWRASEKTEVVELKTPRLKELYLCSLWCRALKLFVPQGSYGVLCKGEFYCVDGISSAHIEALVKVCPMLHTLRVSDCRDLGSYISLESASLKDLTIEGLTEIKSVELRTCKLEKLFLSQVRRVMIYGEALNSIRLHDDCDVYAPPLMRHLSKLMVEGDWTGWSLKEVMSLAKNIRHLVICATISNITEISQDDIVRIFPQLEQFYLVPSLLQVVDSEGRSLFGANGEGPFTTLKVMVIDFGSRDKVPLQNMIMFLNRVLKCSPCLLHLIVRNTSSLDDASEELESDPRFHLQSDHPTAGSELDNIISKCRGES